MINGIGCGVVAAPDHGPGGRVYACIYKYIYIYIYIYIYSIGMRSIQHVLYLDDLEIM